MDNENKSGMVTQEMLNNCNSLICEKLFELSEYEEELEWRATAARDFRKLLLDKLKKGKTPEKVIEYIFDDFYNMNSSVGLTYKEITELLDSYH